MSEKLIFGKSLISIWKKEHPEVEVVKLGPKIQLIDKSCNSRQIESDLLDLFNLPNLEYLTVEKYVITELDRLYKILMRGRKVVAK